MLGLAACLCSATCQVASSAELPAPAHRPAYQAPYAQQPGNQQPGNNLPASNHPARQATYEAPLADPRQAVGPAVAPAAPANSIPLTAAVPRKEPSLPLRPEGKTGGPSKTSGVGALATTLGSLAVVLGLFLSVAWFMRRGLPASAMLLPSEVVEVLGRAPLAGRQQMQLIRCGNKLLLVCLSVGGAETLTEITEAAEVDRLSGLCREAHPHSATAAFRQVFQQFGRERTAQGFLGSTADNHAARAASTRPLVRRPLQEDDDV